jgi:hypothetical protein
MNNRPRPNRTAATPAIHSWSRSAPVKAIAGVVLGAVTGAAVVVVGGGAVVGGAVVGVVAGAVAGAVTTAFPATYVNVYRGSAAPEQVFAPL